MSDRESEAQSAVEELDYDSDAEKGPATRTAWTVALLTSSHDTLCASMPDLRRTVTATCWT